MRLIEAIAVMGMMALAACSNPLQVEPPDLYDWAWSKHADPMGTGEESLRYMMQVLTLGEGPPLKDGKIPYK